MNAGGAYLPLEPLYPRDRLRFMVEDAGARLVIVDGATQPLFTGMDSLPVWWLTEPGGSGSPCPPPQLCPANTVYLIYTSGSTGTPKGVAVPHGALLNLVRAQQGLFGVGGRDVVLQFASCSWDASIWEVVMAMTAGATLVLGPRSAMAPGPRLRDMIHRNGVTVATLPPSILRLLTDEAAPLETIIVGGEACTSDIVDRWAAGRRFFNCYGPTEATICVTASQCVPGEPVELGCPLPNVTVHVLDDRLEPVPDGQVGQICVGGAGVARGYVNRPGLTAERFVPDPWSARPGQRLYCTGDLGCRLPDGSLHFEGRIDHQLKIRGLRIEPGEIEAALRAVPWVRDAAVVPASTGQPAGDVLVAHVATGRPAPDAHELRRYLLDRLPEFMVPAIFAFLEELPRTNSGKVDRRVLASRELSAAPSEPGRPTTSTEETVLEIWSSVLGVTGLSVDANFFDLGGHSLPAVQIAARLHEAFGVAIVLQQLYVMPTVASLSRWIDEEQLAASERSG
jgi:amino acid adenylation domain-containing protein